MRLVILMLLSVADPLVEAQVDRWHDWANVLAQANDATGDVRVPGLAQAWYRAQDKRLFWSCLRNAVQLPLGQSKWQAIKDSWEYREGSQWKTR